MQLLTMRPSHDSPSQSLASRPLRPEPNAPSRLAYSGSVRTAIMDTAIRPAISGRPGSSGTLRPGSMDSARVPNAADTCPIDPTLPRDIASRFGRRVRELRQAKRMTQMEVAVTFGIDRTFISDVERGRKSVCLPTIEVFALGFGVSLSDLLRGI